MVRKTREAFKWIVGILRKYKIPFHVSGGLAARAYGSKRKLADIDIDIPNDCVEKILPDVKSYIIFGPERYVDDTFDALYMALRYKGQKIDISGSTGKFFDRKKRKWIPYKVNFSRYTRKKVLGFIIPVITKEDLIGYKSRILRGVDKKDVEALQR